MTDLYERALARIPGGVSSPVRSFASVGGRPFFTERGEGAYLVDTDGRRYVDYVQSWGASILGHAAPKVVEMLLGQLAMLLMMIGVAVAGGIGLRRAR